MKESITTLQEAFEFEGKTELPKRVLWKRLAIYFIDNLKNSVFFITLGGSKSNCSPVAGSTPVSATLFAS